MITLFEVIDILAMTFFIAFIFKDYFRRVPKPGDYDPLANYRSNFWGELKYSAVIAAPAVVLHEFAHKFVAMGFGAIATLHAPYFMYFVVMVLRLLRFPLVFFVGGYVAHTPLPPLESAAVAIAGPLVNLIMFLLCMGAVKYKWVHRKYFPMIAVSGKLNMFLFIFNILPFPGFDGQHFFTGLWHAFM